MSPSDTSDTKAIEIGERILTACGLRANGDAAWDPQVHDPSFYRRVLQDGSLGLGESYMDGAWDCERLDELIHRLQAGDASDQLPFQAKAWVVAARARAFNWQTIGRSKRAISAHYDLGNEFFERMLGPTMAYSCGYWRDASTLDEAQEAKHELIARKLDIREGDRVLDIGCGWGGFASHVAKTRGCKVVGVTISNEQAAYAAERCATLPVEILARDYRAREVRTLGPFDKVVSIGMFEHVGPRNYRRFMKLVAGLLAPEGLFLLHTIGRHHSDATDEWLNKYIFPDGTMPAAAEITRAADAHFVMEDWHNFRADYDRTLMAWHANFEAWLAEAPTAYEERFIRMWRFYLLVLAGTFRAGHRTQLWQVLYSKRGVAVRGER